MADDDIDVLIEDEPAAKADPDAIGDPPAAKPAAAAKPPVTKPEDGVDVLKKQLEASEAQSAANAARASAAERAVVEAKTETHQTEIQLVEGAIAAVKASLDAAEANYADAMAAGDFAAGAKIQRQMAADAAKQQTLENGLESLKAAPKPTPASPVEKVAATLTPGSAQWIRDHPQFVVQTQDGLGVDARVARAHFAALGEGIVVDTPQYFAYVEGKLGLRDNGAVSAAQPAADTVDIPLADAATATGGRTSTAPPAAPARNGGAGSPRTVRLTQAEVEAAAMSGQTPQEYAKEKERLRAEGRLH